MATTIKITPVLTGEASKQFNRSLSANENAKISDERKKKMKALVDKILLNKH